jgi:hypothetical protein
MQGMKPPICSKASAPADDSRHPEPNDNAEHGLRACVAGGGAARDMAGHGWNALYGGARCELALNCGGNQSR